MAKRIGLWLLATYLFVGAAFAGPIRLHPSNPHYYLFNGQPTVLITSAEHYGAVVNLDFNYVTVPGCPQGVRVELHASLAGSRPGDGRRICERQHHGSEAATDHRALGAQQRAWLYLWGGEFDLDKWDPAYFARLKDFITKAAERGIVVEICFFNAQRSYRWPLSPLYHENNIQNEGKCEFEDFQTLKAPGSGPPPGRLRPQDHAGSECLR